jgi:hypothetical protein
MCFFGKSNGLLTSQLFCQDTCWENQITSLHPNCSAKVLFIKKISLLTYQLFCQGAGLENQIAYQHHNCSGNKLVWKVKYTLQLFSYVL